MTYLNLLIWVCLFVCLGGPLGRAEADAPAHYEIKATIDTTAHRINAHQKVTFTNTTKSPTSSIYFHIYANRQYTLHEKAFMLRYASYFKVDPFPEGFPQSRLSVEHVTINGASVESLVEGKDKTLLKVELKEPLDPGQQVTIDMDFNLLIPHSWGRFGWHKDITALARWYPILAVLTDKGWDQHPFYPFHRPFYSDAATYTVDLTVPSGQVVVHSGDIEHITQADDQSIVHVETSNPIREFSIAMSPKYGVVKDEHDGIVFKAYYVNGNKTRAQEALQDAEDLFDDYAKRFGAYPYKEFSIVPVHLGYGGEQMSNMVFIDTRVFELPKILHRYFDFLIAHESGHQWFYNVVGANDYSEMWLEEATNSYFLLEHLEAKYGKGTDIIDFGRLPKWVKVLVPHFSFRKAQDSRYKIATRIGFERPIISKLSSFNEPSSIFTLTYGKGSKVLGMLQSVVGEETFRRIFARIFKEYRFKNITLADFERITNEESHSDLSWFFDEWLHTTKNFDARILKVRGQDITVGHKGGIVMPVDVDVHYKDGGEEHLVWDGEKSKDILHVSKPVHSVILDKNEKLLDIDRTNNRWPRKVNFVPVPFYHPLYDMPVFLPDDAYNWVVGPEVNNGIGLKTSLQKPYDYSVYAATDYQIGDEIQTTRLGMKMDNFLHSQTTFGIEDIERADYDNGEEDLSTQKVYLRKELWPAPYGLTQLNDHITVYAARNRTPSGSLLYGEEIRNTSYLKHNESIVGSILHMSSARPEPDPRAGYTIDTLIENSGHWAGATQAFTRASVDTRKYQSITAQSKMAYRVKYGWGSSPDKNLFELGGPDGLRGFDRKTVRGANGLLGTAEYRFPLVSGLRLSVFDHTLTLRKISGVGFFDAGQAWYESFDQAKFRKDVGAGIRFHISVGSYLEDIIVRIDVAKALGEKNNDAHTWLGINHSF